MEQPTNEFPISDPAIRQRLAALKKHETFVIEEEPDKMLWFPMWDELNGQWLIQVVWWWGPLVIYGYDSAKDVYALLNPEEYDPIYAAIHGSVCVRFLEKVKATSTEPERTLIQKAIDFIRGYKG